ncbi:hypothetical protein BDZ91DRAFT_802778 [Kalaharituber pfeilii]|nr:hypothetical protein BDZ91DRAFT_802778 [Kalaharituber pfeilii]
MPPIFRLMILLLAILVLFVLIFTFSVSPFGVPLSARTPSLFPRSAIITLVDDHSTFFLARPAAFGPELPEEDGDETGDGGKDGKDGRQRALTGRLVALEEGELGCGDAEGEAGLTMDAEELQRREMWVLTEGERAGRQKGRDRDGESLNGRIVLMQRGGCGFLEKVMWAQRRGAIAVIVGDNLGGRGLVTMYAKGDTSSVTIPSVFTTHTTAQLLVSLMPSSTAPRRPPRDPPVPRVPPIGNPSNPDYHYEDEPGGDNRDGGDGEDGHREGLWVMLACTPGPVNPFLDTLLVLVVSPLGTLGIVYKSASAKRCVVAMLAIRARLQRRRWRAPKSIVESLPVRVYTTPVQSSVIKQAGRQGKNAKEKKKKESKGFGGNTTPPTTDSEGESGADSGVSSASTQVNGDVSHEEVTCTGPLNGNHGTFVNPAYNVPSSSLECVVCLEDYVPNVSRVMRLPCGHEFHVGCITPWLVTRRRTCPICKGDVVKMVREKYGGVTGEDLERGFEDDSGEYGESGGEREESASGSMWEGLGPRVGWRRWIVEMVGGGRGRSVRGLAERNGDGVGESSAGAGRRRRRGRRGRARNGTAGESAATTTTATTRVNETTPLIMPGESSNVVVGSWGATGT